MTEPTQPQPEPEPFRIAITGAAGILGGSIADCLDGIAGALKSSLPRFPMQVVRISRRLDVDLFAFEEMFLRRHPGGVRIGIMPTFDEVIHCAATPYEPGRYSEYEILSNDIGLTLAALRVATESAGKHPPRFVYLSSMTVYEQAPGTAHDHPRPLVETDTDEHPAPVSAIGLSKLMSEAAIRAWSKATGGVHTIFRLNNVISPYEPHDQPGHIATDLYRKLFVERVPELHLAGGGFQVRAFSWFEDVVGGIIDLLSHDAIDNQTFNLGSSRPTSITELARVMAETGLRLGLLPESYKPVIVIDSGSREDVRVPSTEKARELLGWEHKTTLAQMVERFLRMKAGLPEWMPASAEPVAPA